MMGKITLDEEIEKVEATRAWLGENAIEHPVYKEYLDSCSQWPNPWVEEG